MKKIICIGECSLNIVFDADGTPTGSMPGGRIVNAAAILGRGKFRTVMASEASADKVGDMVTDFLADAGVDISSVDRFTEGRTPLNIFSVGADGNIVTTHYENYPEECFDIVWPRIDEGDVVLFGGYYALDRRMRDRMSKLLEHAAERKAVMVYLPGYMASQESRITRVMPAMLENLELADVVIASTEDLKMIFGVDEGSKAYSNHIDFYCRSLICIDAAGHTISYYSGKEVDSVSMPAQTAVTMLWNAGAAAGTVAAIHNLGLTPEDLDAPKEEIRKQILKAALDTAELTAANSTKWQRFK